MRKIIERNSFLKLLGWIFIKWTATEVLVSLVQLILWLLLERIFSSLYASSVMCFVFCFLFFYPLVSFKNMITLLVLVDISCFLVICIKWKLTQDNVNTLESFFFFSKCKAPKKIILNLKRYFNQLCAIKLYIWEY